MQNFVVTGGKKLRGDVTVNASKNATTVLMFAALLNEKKTVLTNVPQIEEMHRLVEVLESLSVGITSVRKTLQFDIPRDFSGDIDRVSASKTRSIIFLLGALSGKKTRFSIPQVGGCRLGERTIEPHVRALEEFGLSISVKKDRIDVLRRGVLTAPKEPIVLREAGDTVTENAILAAAQAKGTTRIHNASGNYMVQDLCHYLQMCGVRIEGIGTSTLTIYGKKRIAQDVKFRIGEDPIEAMFFLSAAIVTGSSITIRRCPYVFLELELARLHDMGFRYTIVRRYKANTGIQLVDIKTKKSRLTAPTLKIHPSPFPGINIDNLPFFSVIAACARGKTLIHDWVFENRAQYFTILRKLGAKVRLLDLHRVTVTGPTRWKSATMICPPALRPGAVVLVAMLAARGTSVLKDVYMINRGYENLAERLSSLGADITLETQQKR